MSNLPSKSPSLNSTAFPSLRNEDRYTLSTRLMRHSLLIPTANLGGKIGWMWHSFHLAGISDALLNWVDLGRLIGLQIAFR